MDATRENTGSTSGLESRGSRTSLCRAFCERDQEVSCVQRAVVTASKSRQKHQQELIHTALMTHEISRRVARENFGISVVSILNAASFEPLLHQSKDDEDEGSTPFLLAHDRQYRSGSF